MRGPFDVDELIQSLIQQEIGSPCIRMEFQFPGCIFRGCQHVSLRWSLVHMVEKLHSLGEKIPEHGVKLVQSRRLRRFRVQVVALRIQPAGPSGDLIRLELIGGRQIYPERFA